jgi:hypothetical protein
MLEDRFEGEPASSRRRTFGRRLAIGIGAITALVLLVGIVIHTPPARALILRWALERARADAGVRIEVGRLAYNLTALTWPRGSYPGQMPHAQISATAGLIATHCSLAAYPRAR